MRKPLSRVLQSFVLSLPVVTLAAGCSSEQSPECVEYVACVQVLDLMTQTDTSEVWSQYDEGGSCWGGDPLNAQACTTGCVAALSAAPTIFDEVPVQCGGDYELPPLSATATVGTGGGKLEVHGLALEVPAGALPGDVEITVENTASFEEWNGALSVTHVYRFAPDGLTFETPVSVTMLLPPAAREDGTTVYWSLPGDDATFEALGGTLEGEGITVEVTHFSRGFAGRPTGEVDAGPAPDGGDPSDDAGEPNVDAGQGERDAGQGERDAGNPPVDGGEPDEDSGVLDGGPAPTDAGDGDGGDSDAPFITWVDPDIVAVGSGDTVITLTGGNFHPTGHAVIDVDIALETTWHAPDHATAVIPAAMLTSPRGTSIGWFNIDPFARSNEFTFAIYDEGGTTDAGPSDAGAFDGGAADPDGPTVYAVEPAEARAGSGDLLIAIRLDDATLTAPLEQIRVSLLRDGGSSLLQPLYRTPDQLYAWIPPNELATPGDAVIKVGSFGTGDSAGLQFRVVAADVGNPLPTVSGTSSTLVRGGATPAERTMVLNGTGFVAGANVLFKYWDVHSPVESVTVLSDTQLEVVLTERQVAAAGTFPVAVQNPPPGGGASPGFSTWVSIGGTNPAPTLTSVEPTPVPAGADTVITLLGSGFVPDLSEVHYEQNASIGKCAVHNDGHTCVVTFPAVLATAGASYSLFVKNESPGGGSSETVTLNVTAP